MFTLAHSRSFKTLVTTLLIGAGASAHAQVLRERHLGANSGSQFAISCANTGDVDSDGTDDFIVGEPWYFRVGMNLSAGHFTVYSGATGVTIRAQDGVGVGDLLGTVVAGAGDVDGKSDVIVGSLNDEIFVVGALGNTINHLTTSSGYSFGYSVAGCGDLDGDGVKDFVVGEPAADVGPFIDLGGVVAFSGATGGYLYNTFGSNSGDRLGGTLASLGDVDQDGVHDYIAGGPVSDANGTDSGIVRVISGRWGGIIREQTGDGIGEHHGATIYEWYGVAGSNRQLGSSVASGDWNRDGIADLLSGDRSFDSGGSLLGSVDVELMCPAWWTNYGTGWAGNHGIPTLTSQQDPEVGSPIDLHLSNSLGAATTALLFVGVQDANIPLKNSGTLLVTPILALVLPVPSSGLILSDVLPSDPALYFLDLYLQALEVDKFASKGFSFTAGLQLHCGYDLP